LADRALTSKKDPLALRITQIRKRDGRIVPFNNEKITSAIYRAVLATGGRDRSLAESLSTRVVELLDEKYGSEAIPAVEDVQDVVERVLVENGHAKVAKDYIIYRQKRAEIRLEKQRVLEKESIDEVDKAFDLNALRVLKARYLKKDETGKLTETPKQLFTRIAVHGSLPDLLYDDEVFDVSKKQEAHDSENFDPIQNDGKVTVGQYALNRYHLEALKRMYDRFNRDHTMKTSWSRFFELLKTGYFSKYEQRIQSFYDIMVSRKFMPNTPAIANFGNVLGMGSACFVLGVDDSIESIMETLKQTAVVFKAGGGMGYNFSHLRPEGDYVSSTSGVASGPISFMMLFDTMTDVIKQGGIRRGANMGILNCLSGEIVVSTLNGRFMIRDLVGQKPYLYCLNDKGEVRIRQAELIAKSGEQKLVRVHFDDDTHIDCTPNHRIMMSNGKYVEAKELHQLDSVTAFHKKILNEKYFVGSTRSDLVPEHIVAAECFTGKLISQNGKRRKPGNLCVHHLDGNSLNNNPENLKIVTVSEHGKIHADNLAQLQEEIASRRKGKTLEAVYGAEKAREWRMRMSDAAKRRTPWNSGLTGEDYKRHYEDGFGNQFSRPNHKVVSVEPLDGIHEVFDIVMPDWPNFVANGVFVHNSNHPDIEKFVTAKKGNKALRNFNISVLIMPEFWDSFKNNKPYPLINPRTGQVVRQVNPRLLFDMIVYQAWESAEPGVIFFDHVNEHNPFYKHLGPIVTTNPCGEVLLYPNESCNLGSINVWAFVKRDENGKVTYDWDGLREAVYLASRFLDNVIDVNNFPLKAIEEMTLATRKIGLGVMGLADLLLELRSPYNSDEGRKLMEELMEFINYHSKIASVEMARERGPLLYYDKSFYPEGKLPFAGFYDKKSWHFEWDKIAEKIKKHGIRNGYTTVIAPTGSISMIAGCSSGMEPVYSMVYEKHVTVGSFYYIDPVFERVMTEEGLFGDDLLRDVNEHGGSIQKISYIPEDLKRIYITAMDIRPEDHIRALAGFQKWTDSSISKTNNFPANATIEDMRDSYLLAYKLGCKDVTVFRDTSIKEQVLVSPRKKQEGNSESHNSEGENTVRTLQLVTVPLVGGSHGETEQLKLCPQCQTTVVFQEGCYICPECRWGACS